MDFIKKVFIFICIIAFTGSSVMAEDLMNTVGNINHEFKLSEIPEYVYLRNAKEIIASEEIIIPENSLLKLKTIRARKERRWHKSGYIITKLENFTPETSVIPYDLSDDNIYLTVRKYEPVDKKEAAILTTEIIVTMGASYFAPGVDIAYFFAKGAILREKHPNWFLAGVSNAYDNSIFWFWLKGKPIELEKDSQIKIQSLDEQKVSTLTSQIDKINEKNEFKTLKKENKKLKKSFKQIEKSDKNIEDEIKKEQSEKYQKKLAKKEEKLKKKELKKAEKLQKKAEKEQSEKYQKKLAKKEERLKKRELKKAEKLEKKLKKEQSEKYQYKKAKKQIKKDKKAIEKISKIQKHIKENNKN